MQEDSVILNQSSVDRGLFRSTTMKTVREEARRTNREEFGTKPGDKVVGRHQAGYDKVDVDGLAAPGTRVREGDVLVHKTAPAAGSGGGARARRRKDLSAIVKKGDDGVVDAVCSTVDENDNHIVKIRVRSHRIATVGDKLASRHGQKGVCGAVRTQEDLPWTAEGIVPDVIINPHCIPSRMTVGHLLEALVGKAATLSGQFGDGTAFRSGDPRREAEETLLRAGYHKHGEEVLYNPHTGLPMAGTTFITPTFYQRLKHMVADKVHARGRGPVTVLTKQPVEGRARMGGLRFGEMERDGAIAHGATAFLTERLLHSSDSTKVPVCRTCGLLAYERATDAGEPQGVCNLCGARADIRVVTMPHAARLLLMELQAMCVVPRLTV